MDRLEGRFQTKFVLMRHRFNLRQRKLPVFLQMEACECGLASMAMVAAFHGSGLKLADIRRDLPTSRKGLTAHGLVKIADALGLIARPVKLDLDELHHLQLPCILHWDMDHFVVLRSLYRGGAVLHDPAIGVLRVSMKEFGRHFTGVAIECEPSSHFSRQQSHDTGIREWLSNVPGLWSGLGHIVLLTFFLELLAIFTPVLLQWIVDDALPVKNVSLLNGLALGFALLVIIGATLEIIRGWLAAVASTDLNLRWSGRVLTHLLRLPISYFERRHAGDIMSSFGSITTVQKTFSTGFIEALVDGAMAVGTLAMMAWYSLTGAGLALGMVILYGLFRLMLQGRLRQAWSEQIAQTARQQSHFLETLRGIQGVRLFGRADQRHRGWANLAAAQTNAELNVQGLQISYTAAQQLMFGLLRVLVIWFASWTILRGSVTLGMLFAFLAYLDQFTRRAAALLDRLLELTLLRLHIDRVSDIMLTPVEPSGPAVATMRPEHVQSPPLLQLRQLEFSYAFDDAPVLNCIDLDVAPGECVALVGSSGSGKTTLVKLMLGLLEPTRGEIRVGGVPLTEIGVARFREMVGTVMQDDLLFTGSLADNICFFDPEPDTDWMIDCARQAAIHSDIENMPMQYATLTGEGGSGLSGGQKQRILLARSLYKRPRILVLDEATSHLDVANERRVNDAIKSLALTRIIVAHRPETIAMADRVVEVANGRIAKIWSKKTFSGRHGSTQNGQNHEVMPSFEACP